MTTMAAHSAEAAPALEFAQSESRAVGMSGGLNQTISQYAPRIASTLKLASSSSILAMGVKAATVAGAVTAPAALTVVAGMLLLASGGVMIVYGDKEKQKKRAARMGEQPPEYVPTDPVGRILHDAGKMLSPAKYPIEAASGYGLIAATCLAISGVLTANWYIVGVGGLSVIAGMIALFGREKKKHEQNQDAAAGGLNFMESQSKPVGVIDGVGKKLSGNPMLLSSIFLIANSLVALKGGIEKDDTFLTIAGVCSLIANILLGVFVRKNDYNVNAAKENTGVAAPQTKISASALQTDKLQVADMGAALA